MSAELERYQPATDALIATLAKCVRDVAEHDHPNREDLYCLNLVAFMGERMGPVLRRLEIAGEGLEVLEREIEDLRGEIDSLTLSLHRADDDLAAKDRELSDALEELRLARVALAHTEDRAMNEQQLWALVEAYGDARAAAALAATDANRVHVVYAESEVRNALEERPECEHESDD